MSARAVVVLASVLSAGALALAAPAPARTVSPTAAALAREAVVARARGAEVARIQRHFDSVLVELAAADTRALTGAQRASRARQIARLTAYRDRGVFPRNEHFPDSVLPYFVDRSGTRCAVAHLMHLDGREPIVRNVTRARNNAWVAELRDEPGLAAWLHEAGLTFDEAARIQVPYVGDPEPIVSPDGASSRSGTPYAAASAVAALASGATIAYALRADAPRRSVMVAGAAVGAASVALGASRLGDRGSVRALGAANAVVGGAAAAFAIRSLFRHDDATASAQRERRVAVAPVVGREVGVTLAARF